MMPILRNFDLAIIKAPKEGIMGLNKDGKAIILRNGDMVSMSLLDEKFAELMFTRGMLKPIRSCEPEQIKGIERSSKTKTRLSRKNRGRKNGMYLDKWLFGGGKH